MHAQPSAGIALHVETDGSGSPLLLLPGFACSAEAWGAASVDALADRCLLLRPDWPDTGPLTITTPVETTLRDLLGARIWISRNREGWADCPHVPKAIE